MKLPDKLAMQIVLLFGAIHFIQGKVPLHVEAHTRNIQQPHQTMKSQDAKKEKKKAPQKTAKEKKLAKAEKKKNR